MKPIFFICLMLCAYLLSETTDFQVSVWGVHVADVSLSKRDTLFHEQACLQINLRAETVGMSSTLYPVQNQYSLIVDAETYGLRYFTKNTSQPGIVNILETTASDLGICYTNTTVCLPDSALTIFSLLVYLAENQPQSLHSSVLEREGLFYTADVEIINEDDSVINYNLQIDLNSHQAFGAVLKDTDIFSWAVFKPGAKRLIQIDRKKHRIRSCEFQFGLMKLSAGAMKK